MPCGLVGFVAVITDGCGEIKFPTLGYFVKSLLSWPHSNAGVERIFPKLLLSKLSNGTDRLETTTLDSLLMNRSGLPINLVNCRPKICMCSSLNFAMYGSVSDSSEFEDACSVSFFNFVPK